MKLDNTPPKGTTDWLPEEFKIRKYIFDTWRAVLESYGYEEYLTPLLEEAAVYRAKSGEDLGGKELWSLTDLAGREYAIRPEMTPSVTRMVTTIYNSTPKPIRLFSIANFMRNEKPQRGRNREFWQLNFDIFGTDDLSADIEVLKIALEIMISFGASKDQFELRLNSRKLIEDFLKNYLDIEEKNYIPAIRILDKLRKIPFDSIVERLEKEAGAQIPNREELKLFFEKEESVLQKMYTEVLKDSEGVKDLMKIYEVLGVDFEGYYTFAPDLMRGLDYYNGMVFEVFDKHPENKRALFGGGRYGGLASIFGSADIPAVGCAPGDETTKLFLEAWDLIPEELGKPLYFIPIVDNDFEKDAHKIAKQLRKEGKRVLVGLSEQKIGKALDYANKIGAAFTILYAEDEAEKGLYVLKNMKSGDEDSISFD